MKFTENTLRTRLTYDHLNNVLRIATIEIITYFEKLFQETKRIHQVSHQHCCKVLNSMSVDGRLVIMFTPGDKCLACQHFYS